MSKKSVIRLSTKTVDIGGLTLGGSNPIAIQSMTTTDTMDTKATVGQIIRIIKAGADLVRITAPSIREAENLSNIKKELSKQGFKTPLIADIHYTPNAAEIAARIVEKVRINPGNYADKKKFEIKEYNDSEYNNELEKIRNKFLPLIKICKEYGTALRIGTNHGSLSDRIMSRYGDTPLGMVESALEFVRICREEGFHNIVLSMKSSNPKVMIESNRLLVKKMIEKFTCYPIHLGVTEAGDGEDGRIKSALGIGTLLEEGIGDTIRVSLTEEPELEIPVCKILRDRYKHIVFSNEYPYEDLVTNLNNNLTTKVENIGGNNPPIVAVSSSPEFTGDINKLTKIGYSHNKATDKWTISEASPDFIYAGLNKIGYELPGTLKIIYHSDLWNNLPDAEQNESFPILTEMDLLMAHKFSDRFNFIYLDSYDISAKDIQILKVLKSSIIVLNFKPGTTLNESKRIYNSFRTKGITTPIVFHIKYQNISEEEFTVFASTDLGGLLIEDIGDGIWVKYKSISKANNVCFGILQAARRRISKTEYISCPSCGRTLFDLQKTTSKIRNATNHLKGIKIGIMGCIVNGPGEMADADYGYVGSGVGKVTLYKKHKVIKRNIPSDKALEELINLIKENGDWKDKEQILNNKE